MIEENAVFSKTGLKIYSNTLFDGYLYQGFIIQAQALKSNTI